MKKRVYLAIGIICLVGLQLCACGEKERTRIEVQLDTRQPADVDKSDEEEIEELIKELNEEEAAAVAVQEQDIEEEVSVYDELMAFEVLDEVKNSDFSDGLIQIGDVVIYPMETTEEIMSGFENSSLDWEYEYNPDKLVTYSPGTEHIFIYYKGELILTLLSYNYMADQSTIAFKDCLATRIKIEDDYKECFKYCIDANTTYTDFSAKYKDSDSYDERSSGNTILVSFSIPVEDRQIDSMGIYFHDLKNYINVFFDANDGSFVSFEYGTPIMYSYDKIE